MKNLPKAITFPQFSSITAYDDDDDDNDSEEEEDVFMGDMPSNTCESLLVCLVQIRRLDCGIRTVGFTSGTRKQK